MGKKIDKTTNSVSHKKQKLSNLQKMTYILKILNKPPYKYTASEISDMTGINRTTVYRTLMVLAEEDFIIQDEFSRKFAVGPMLYHIGLGYLNNYHFKDEIYKIIKKVADITSESVGISVREGNKIISLYEIEIQQPLKMNYPPGSYYPMNRGCFGKCLMAYHDKEIVRNLLEQQKFEKLFPNTLTEIDEILNEYQHIRKNGFVVSDAEVYSLIAAGVGVPVYNSRNQVKACLAISFVKDDKFDFKKQKFLKILQKYAKEITIYMP